jgi:hypothetical protein
MFSGHTLFYIVFALAWQKYFFVIERVLFWLATLFSISTLIASRLHYLNDIIIAAYGICGHFILLFFFLTFSRAVISLVWYIYHIHVANAPRRCNPIIAWLESDVTIGHRA